MLGNMFALGSMYTFLTGYLVHSWRTVAWLQLLPSTLMGISVFFIPDSPYWLVEKGRLGLKDIYPHWPKLGQQAGCM